MALSESRLVNVSISLSPMAAQTRGFGTLCILGDSSVLGAEELYRTYSSVDEVLEDFGQDAEETIAAQAYFSQSPKPTSLVVARWDVTPSAGKLVGGKATDTQADLQPANGGFTIDVDGHSVNVKGDFSQCLTFAAVAAKLGELLTGVTVTVSGHSLTLTSKTTGAASGVGFATAPTEKGVTDLSAKLGLTEKAGAVKTQGKAIAETVSDAVTRLVTKAGRSFYGLVTASATALTDDDRLQIAQLIESAEDSHIYGITLTDRALASEVYTTEADDLAAKLMRGQNTRTAVFFADYDADDAAYRLNKYFAASALGRMFTVNFNGSKTTLTLKFKQAQSLQPSDLGTSEVTNLEARNSNVYATYKNGTYIIEPGVMASGMHCDERHGLDWLQNALQTAVFNLFYQSKTKIPQTDDGVTQIQARLENVLQQGVENGLIAPGKWNSDGFGSLEDGDYLDAGYYVYAGSIVDQAQSDREARKSPAFQIAVKLAGAIESVDVMVSVNR